MKNVQLTLGLKFASHVVFKEALKDHKNSKISSRWLVKKYLALFEDDHTLIENTLRIVMGQYTFVF